ncbi:protein kinase domain-containing protein [Deinococcus cellulosilyticus]|uniref:Serine/threonine protein kinase n=1 Tax=Deinococcus cellulosilyticus (strain DSM 18568 / NBRC 106333 / KACC 11606 / 5516J-15) TaxID=1223518 RepID=A0A511MY23_DEIC1|nr:protein kinase [Deinococcus cellulosilyticus]GEM45188.1 serine/threonine protein kinase [Deinococcus cellulosilyticus NBRC 106333 = KACC 11606]
MVWLILIFVVSGVLWYRTSERVLALALAVITLLFVTYLVSFSTVERALTPALIASFLIGTSFYVTKFVPVKGPNRKQRRKPRARLVRQGGELQLNIRGYQILERIGEGGMAVVHLARRLEDEKLVAIKVPLEKHFGDNKVLRRFVQEAATLKRLEHPNIVRVFDYNADTQPFYMIMEYVKGQSLEGYMLSQPVSVPSVLNISRAVCDALRYIHSQGLVHRDVKPSNIMLMRDQITQGDIESYQVRLMDFGIAVGQAVSRLSVGAGRVGTPIYMSPEQAKGGSVDARSDIYSLGMVMYEMAAGRTPFAGSYDVVVHQQVFDVPTPPRQYNVRIPISLNDLIMRMLEKDPANRPTLDEVLRLIDSGDLVDNSIPSLPSTLVVVTNSGQNFIRVLDTQGNLLQGLGNMESGVLPTIPVACHYLPDGNLLVGVVDYKTANAPMLRILNSEMELVGGFAPYGLKEGNLLNLVSVAVTPSKRIYALDLDTCMVQEYTLEGEMVRKFGGRGDGQGTFREPRMIAANDEFVFVLDTQLREVQRFSPDGTYISRVAFKQSKDAQALQTLDGVGVDLKGNVLVSDASSSRIRVMSPAGKPVSAVLIDPWHGEPSGELMIDVDHEGHIYAARKGGQLIRKYSADGQLMGMLDALAPVLAFSVRRTVPVSVKA